MLQVTRAQISLTQLNVINAMPRGLGNLFDQPLPALTFVAGKLLSIGDVVEKQVISNSYAARFSPGGFNRKNRQATNALIAPQSTLFNNSNVVCHDFEKWIRRLVVSYGCSRMCSIMLLAFSEIVTGKSG